MTIYLFVIIYHLFIAALHCQPPVWTIWSVLQRQVWLWGEYREYCEYSPLLKRRVRWSLSLSHSFSEMIACSVFWHWLQVIVRYRILLQVRKSAEHSLNMPLRYQSWILMSTIFWIFFSFSLLWTFFYSNIRFVWGAHAEDNGHPLDPGDRGFLRWI